MKKVSIIIGARPNFMKAFPVYEALKEDFELTLIHTGQHFDAKMSDVFFNQLKFPRPDIHLSLEKKTKSGDFDDKLYVNNTDYLKDKDAVIEELMSYDGDLGQLGEIRDKLKIEFEKGKPDLVIVFGDVTSTLSAGLAAKMLNIELAHVESGLRSGDLKMPEEVNRVLTDHITKYYFVTEQSGIDNFKKLGITENVYLVGNTMIDTQKKYLQQALNTKYHETLGVKSKEYVLITLHRPSNVDDLDKLKEIFDDFKDLSKKETLVYPIHPRTKNNLEKLGYLQKVQENSNIILDEPLGYLEFTCLMANCKYLVTDSGGLQEESTSLDIPCFTLRENTERPSTFIENHGTNQLIHKISEINLKECKGSMDLWDGKSSERILVELLNIIKRNLLVVNKLSSKKICEIGLYSKIGTYNFCIENHIPVPKILYCNINCIIGSIEEIFKYNNFIIKIENTCSTNGIYPLIKTDDNKYKCLFKKKRRKKYVDITMSKEYIIEHILLKEDVIVEESLLTCNSENNFIIPHDYKVYVINNQYNFMTEFNRNVGEKGEISTFNLNDGSNITKIFWKGSSSYDLNFLRCLESEKIKIIKNFLDEHIFKLNHNGLMSWYLYIHNNKCYLGEFTLHPGLLHFSNVFPEYCRQINNDLENCLYKNSYRFKTINVNNLENDMIEGNFHYNYKGLNFLSKLSCKNKNLVIIFHGAVPGNGKDRIVFRGYNYEIDDTNIVCISDYLLNIYDDYKVNWTLSTDKHNVEYIYDELFTYLINQQKYNKIIFTGTSAGGFPSLKFACKFNCIALISNSQIYIEEYGKNKGYGFDQLKNMVEKNNDKLLYENKQIEHIIYEYKPKKAIIFNNENDSTYKTHTVPLIQYINNNKISHLFQINSFDYDGIIPTGKTHHAIQFPDNTKHIDILREFIKTN